MTFLILAVVAYIAYFWGYRRGYKAAAMEAAAEFLELKGEFEEVARDARDVQARAEEHLP